MKIPDKDPAGAQLVPIWDPDLGRTCHLPGQDLSPALHPQQLLLRLPVKIILPVSTKECDPRKVGFGVIPRELSLSPEFHSGGF